MGGGEYNNLGHYMVKYDKGEETVFRPCTIHDLNVNSMILSHYNEVSARNTHKIMNSVFTIEMKCTKKTIKALKKRLCKHLISNNQLKMHGLPMRRKVKRKLLK